MIVIRNAATADAAGIARVHVDTWRSAYRGIVPEEYLASLSHDQRVISWGKFLGAMPPRQHVLVALDDTEQVVGFSNAGGNRSVEYAHDGEVVAIYLFEEHQGRGIGRRLLQASINRLAADGFRQMLVWVLADNHACRFYERMGGQVIGEKMTEIGGKALKELAYGWDDLSSSDRVNASTAGVGLDDATPVSADYKEGDNALRARYLKSSST